ncbi:MAG TPA: MBL fold metallo-hydrolase [Candidatus Acidoferrales bacterium]|nr:MBL fold metallo-hydrolase [Candidatus Acidoferrales bacterium]
MAYAKITTVKLPLPPKEILADVFAFPPNPDSFGGISYLIKGESQNFMVDVPEHIENNVSFISKHGVPQFIFLTHRDDVADAEMFRKKFGARLIIHESEKYAVGKPDITFRSFYEIGDAVIIHTPGHSPGSSSLFYSKEKVMFTGDHVTADRGKPVAENFSWTYDYELQIESARRLLDFDFEYILAGHGGRWLISNAKNELKGFLERNG